MEIIDVVAKEVNIITHMNNSAVELLTNELLDASVLSKFSGSIIIAIINPTKNIVASSINSNVIKIGYHNFFPIAVF